MSDDEMEDYGFEYSDEEELEDNAVDIENTYYNSKGLLEDEEWDEALGGFRKVLQMEKDQGDKGEWGFRALKQIIKLHFRAGRMQEVVSSYDAMLEYMKGAVTKNHAEKKVSSTLEHLSACEDTALLQQLYEATLRAVADQGNERLWFKTNVRLANLWVHRHDWARLTRVLRELRKSCLAEDGSEDARKGTQLLEVYALEIQMHTEQGNSKRLKEIYTHALTVKSAIPHPRIMGVIRECGGKMHARERQWMDAATAFFEAFKSYDEAGHPRRLQCLKYLVLAYMLNQSNVDPFNAQEAKPYKSDPEVVAMTSLVEAYQSNHIDQFERVLRTHRRQIMGDTFIASHIEDLLRTLRTQVLLELLRPYKAVRVPFVCAHLNVTEEEVEKLLVTLIHEGKVRGRIDQVNKMLRMEQASTEEDAQYEAMGKWADSLSSLAKAVVHKLV